MDEAVVGKIRSRLGQGKEQSRYEVDALVERLMVQYERTIYQIKTEFREGLSIFTLAKRSFLSVLTCVNTERGKTVSGIAIPI